MKKRSIKVIFVALLFLVAAFTTLRTFAYWDNLQTGNDSTVELGEGTRLVVSANNIIPEGKKFVPLNAVLGVHDINTIELTYTVKLSKTTLEDLELVVEATNVKIGENNQLGHILSIEIVQDERINSEEVVVTILVRMNPIEDYATYLAIRNQMISFDLVFTANVVQ